MKPFSLDWISLFKDNNAPQAIDMDKVMYSNLDTLLRLDTGRAIRVLIAADYQMYAPGHRVVFTMRL